MLCGGFYKFLSFWIYWNLYREGGPQKSFQHLNEPVNASAFGAVLIHENASQVQEARVLVQMIN